MTSIWKYAETTIHGLIGHGICLYAMQIVHTSLFMSVSLGEDRNVLSLLLPGKSWAMLQSYIQIDAGAAGSLCHYTPPYAVLLNSLHLNTSQGGWLKVKTGKKNNNNNLKTYFPENNRRKRDYKSNINSTITIAKE